LSQGDRGKETTSEQSTKTHEDFLSEEEIFSSTNPKKTIRKIVRKENMELHSFIQIRPQT
jgi:hypothetical protein